MKVGDEVIIRNKEGGHEFKVGEKVVITEDLGAGQFMASNGRDDWYVNPENFKVMIVIPTLRAFVVKQMSPNFGRITDQSNGKRTAFVIYNDEMMNNASKILSGRGINIVSYSFLTKDRGLLLSDDMDTPILNV